MMNSDHPKQCIVPGCNKALPARAKLPVCDYHIGEAKEASKKATTGIVTLGGAVLLLVKSGGATLLKEGLPKAGSIAKNIINKKL